MLLVGLFLSGAFFSFAQSSWVDPFIGTDGMGHTFPGACVPFGMVQLSPDTDTIPHNVAGVYQKEVYSYCAGYRYSDPTIVGFSHTHLSGTGHSDLGDILLMPSTGVLRLNPGTSGNPDSGYRSRFSHGNEEASPGYYRVRLEDYGIEAEMTATPRAGVHRYTFPEGGETGHLVMDLTHGIYNYDGKVLWSNVRVENDSTLTGYRITNGWSRTDYTYFAIRFSRPIKDYGFKEKTPSQYNGFWRKFDQGHGFPEMGGRGIVCWFDFSFEDGNVLEVKVALSPTGTDGAMKNLEEETSGKDFAIIRKEAAALWDKELSSIRAEGTPEQKTMLYTSYYHTLINPSLYCDVDGRYRGLDGNVHESDGGENYTVFSLWDTYRAEHPFLLLMKPERAKDMIGSMLSHWSQSVHRLLPVWSLMGNEGWCMSGYHAVSVLADAIVKGLDIDEDKAAAAMFTTSNVPYLEGLGEYVDKGYVPLEKSSTAASTTLEYSYDDFAIFAAARRMGLDGMQINYRRRAENWMNVFDPETGFARPKYSSGAFKTPFDPLRTDGEGFIEGNSWNFSFHVPQDVTGLVTMMGGDAAFIRRLDDLFGMHLAPEYYADNEDITEDCLIGGYVHGNEPSHHVPYLYAWTSQPWKTQSRVRDILNRMYRSGIRGLGGNDDCGQMSAWYLFSAMGFYPVCPGTDQYIIGAPYFPHMEVDRPGGRTLVIKAEGVGDSRPYVKEILFNGKRWDKRYFTHSDLMQGGVLEFKMAAKPDSKDAAYRSAYPYSLSMDARRPEL
ncbi:MAG: GH92 family glycosyl hydrolase [Bacteroidales bacterium]|nr:GH92 family glycosyl hydrolase [Bacteroidales bacterium]